MVYHSKNKDWMKWIGTWEATNLVGDGRGITNLPAGTETDPTFQGASAAITASLALVDPHIADGDIHFTSDALHASLALVDPHIASSAIHFAEASITHDNIISGTIASHDTTVTGTQLTTMFSQVATNVTDISNNTASAALIDPHIADDTIHFTSDALHASVALLDPHIADADAHHLESHNIASHADTSGTGAELDELTDGSETDLHSHAGMGEETDPIWNAQSAAFTAQADFETAVASQATISGDLDTTIASLAVVEGEVDANTASATLIDPHIADSSDPHGAALTQTSMAIIADNDASGAAVVRNILIGTEETPPAAASVVQGTIYLQYTD